jgi:hypothetical protein
MSPSKKNPFEIFGLTPEMTDTLGEAELYALVKSLYRALLKVYHPDKGRSKSAKRALEDAARAVELNLAFEQVNLEKDGDSFRRHRRLYAARRSKGLRKKIAGLERELRELREKRTTLADGFMQYLLDGLPWLDELKDEPGRPRLAPTNLKLGLNDVAINQNVRAMSWSLGSNYKEIAYDALGGMFYRPVGRSKPFPVNYIQLIGSIDVTQLDLLPLLDRVSTNDRLFKYPALDSRYGIDGAPLQVLNSITQEKFKTYCLPLLRPDLKERAFLFSIHRPIFESEGRVTVEGVIVKVTRL